MLSDSMSTKLVRHSCFLFLSLVSGEKGTPVGFVGQPSLAVRAWRTKGVSSLALRAHRRSLKEQREMRGPIGGTPPRCLGLVLESPRRNNK